MKSMTGFAKIQCETKDAAFSIEIKTLNSKQMDANMKLSVLFREKELEIRSLLNRLDRGKIDFSIIEERKTNAAASQLNTEVVKTYYHAYEKLATHLNQPTDNILPTLLTFPDVWTVAPYDMIHEELWDFLRSQIEKTIDQVDAFRLEEGEILKKDFIQRIYLIEEKLNKIPQYELERITIAKERIRKYLSEINIKVDENRFEQEFIYYLEKLDITEEKVRLKKHIVYFLETLDESGSIGKKLGFIAQELGREINTIGSKANHVEIQRLVVEMKDELEKIKEQLGNIL